MFLEVCSHLLQEFNQKSLWFNIYFTTLIFVAIAQFPRDCYLTSTRSQSHQARKYTKFNSHLGRSAKASRFPREPMGNPQDSLGRESEHMGSEKPLLGPDLFLCFSSLPPPPPLFSFEELQTKIISTVAGKAEKVLNSNHIFGSL